MEKSLLLRNRLSRSVRQQSARGTNTPTEYKTLLAEEVDLLELGLTVSRWNLVLIKADGSVPGSSVARQISEGESITTSHRSGAMIICTAAEPEAFLAYIEHNAFVDVSMKDVALYISLPVPMKYSWAL